MVGQSGVRPLGFKIVLLYGVLAMTDFLVLGPRWLQAWLSRFVFSYHGGCNNGNVGNAHVRDDRANIGPMWAWARYC